MKSIQQIVLILFSAILVNTATGQALDSSRKITPDIALKAIAIFEQNPLSEDAKTALSVLTAFAAESEEVHITVDSEKLPWVMQKNKYIPLLVGAFIAGNVKAQLVSKDATDHPIDGALQVISTYEYLKQHSELDPVPEIEKWIASIRGNDDDAIWLKELVAGCDSVKAGKYETAILKHFDPALTHYESMYRDCSEQLYCARSSKEALYYLLQAASFDGQKKPTVFRGPWAEFYYAKAYALLEIGRIEESRLSLTKAKDLSPRNSKYLSELGHIHQLNKNWSLAMETFQAAEQAAEFSPPEMKDQELSRAWRGIGYVLVELDRLDEAEKKYNQCLSLDPNDKKALEELGYIKRLKDKKASS